MKLTSRCSRLPPRRRNARPWSSRVTRLRLLRDDANLDHIQTDAKSMTVRPDLSGPDFFFYDISWVDFCSGRPNHEEIADTIPALEGV